MQAVLIVFAILSIVGGWTAWRRSPLYSHKVTWQLGGVLLLIAAAMAGLGLAMVSGPIGRSPAAQAVLMVVAVVGIGTGATGIIIRLTDSHVAQLPPSVRLISTHRHKVQRWIWRILVYELVCAAAALVLRGSWIWLPLSLGGFVLLACGPTLLALYMRARRLDLGMSQVVADPWVHWQYTPPQWQSWAQNQLAWERSKIVKINWRKEWRKTLKFSVLMLSVFLGCAWIMVDGSALEKITGSAIGMVVTLIAIAGVSWIGRGACERRYRRLLAAPPEAYLGDEGLFCNGEYAPWILSGGYLVEASAPRDAPARLVMVFRTFNGSSSTLVARRIPIPEGQAPDLEALQQKLRGRCPKASVHLTAVSLESITWGHASAHRVRAARPRRTETPVRRGARAGGKRAFSLPGIDKLRIRLPRVTRYRLTNSTRRFWARPSGLSFEPMGCAGPKPLEVSRAASTPNCETSTDRTASARRFDRSRL
jgi:hypothetical protein